MLHDYNLQKELEYLDTVIARCRRQLEKMPPGKLIIAKSTGHVKWYVSTNGHSDGIHYLPKSGKENQMFAEQLAYKRYITCLMEESLAKKRILSSCLKSLQKEPCKSDKILSDPEYQKLLKVSYMPQDERLKKWASEKYVSNPNHPENLKFPSPTGHILRSKSEAIIDMMLSTHQLPFRYEAALSINGMDFYPDFTIRHPRTGKFYYWEHFGLVDQTAYLDKCVQKVRNYMKSGIIPKINLITSYETNEKPLTPKEVEDLIQFYFG